MVLEFTFESRAAEGREVPNVQTIFIHSARYNFAAIGTPSCRIDVPCMPQKLTGLFFSVRIPNSNCSVRAGTQQVVLTRMPRERFYKVLMASETRRFLRGRVDDDNGVLRPDIG